MCLEKFLKNNVVNQANQPEDDDEGEEKYWIDHSHEHLAEIYLPVILLLTPRPDLGAWSLLMALSKCMLVGLHDDVHEGFEETEDQPAVEHLDVRGLRKISAHT